MNAIRQVRSVDKLRETETPIFMKESAKKISQKRISLNELVSNKTTLPPLHKPSKIPSRSQIASNLDLISDKLMEPEPGPKQVEPIYQRFESEVSEHKTE